MILSSAEMRLLAQDPLEPSLNQVPLDDFMRQGHTLLLDWRVEVCQMVTWGVQLLSTSTSHHRHLILTRLDVRSVLISCLVFDVDFKVIYHCNFNNFILFIFLLYLIIFLNLWMQDTVINFYYWLFLNQNYFLMT